jgi:hypothetical protein
VRRRHDERSVELHGKQQSARCAQIVEKEHNPARDCWLSFLVATAVAPQVFMRAVRGEQMRGAALR